VREDRADRGGRQFDVRSCFAFLQFFPSRPDRRRDPGQSRHRHEHSRPAHDAAHRAIHVILLKLDDAGPTEPGPVNVMYYLHSWRYWQGELVWVSDDQIV